jgi:uncharacterized coiled-coil protein SlyX
MFSRGSRANNLQIQGKEQPVTIEYLERIIAELRQDISNQEQATQKAVANCKAQINELYHLFKTLVVGSIKNEKEDSYRTLWTWRHT